MAPFIRSNLRWKDNFLTLSALRRGLYKVDLSRTIDKMSERLSRQQLAVSVISENATLYQIRNTLVDSQNEILNLADTIESEEKYVEDAASATNDIATCAVWRLACDLIAAGVFSVVGLVSFLAKRKIAGTVALIAAGAFVVSFLDELDIRSVELNEQFDGLRESCNELAENLVTLAVLKNNHNFVCGLMKDRFGEAFTDDHVDQDDLLETYNPDAPGGG